MSFTSHSEHDAGINEINMTPLVDVMLVLLIIFIVTIPVVKQAIDIDLPDVVGVAATQESETIEITVTAKGEYYLNGLLTNDEDLKFKFKTIADNQKNTEHAQIASLQIHGDKDAKYSSIAQVMSLAQQSGIYKIGFVMDGAATSDLH